MEFLLGNPFATPVGQSLEKATDGSLQSEDWTLNMEICDIINETEEGPKDAVRALKKRLNGNKNYREVMLALTVLETCVKNCGHRFHILVANRDFIDGVLVKIISPKNNPPTIVQDKVLALIQAWADAFRSSPDLTGVVHIYEELKRKGIEFPVADLDALSPIHTPQRSVPEIDPAANMHKSQSQQKMSPSPSPTSFPTSQAPTPNGADPIIANTEQIARLRSELDVVRGNTKVMSEMLTEMIPGQEDSSDLELLQELNRTCRAMQQRIVELISRVSNEEVTEELLHANDDLNNIFLRYERFERYRLGRSAQNGVLNEVSEDNLIDLGPGSPAVVSPMVGNTAPASTLSTQLAGLDLGTNNVSGALSSLPPSNPRDDFDVFAQTRGGGSLADQHKIVTREDPPVAKGRAPAPDTRKPNSGGRRGKGGSCPMEPIDRWLISQGMVRTVLPSSDIPSSLHVVLTPPGVPFCRPHHPRFTCHSTSSHSTRVVAVKGGGSLIRGDGRVGRSGLNTATPRLTTVRLVTVQSYDSTERSNTLLFHTYNLCSIPLVP